MSGQLSKCASLRVSNYPYFCGQRMKDFILNIVGGRLKTVQFMMISAVTAKAEACNPNAELPGLIVGKKSYNSMDAVKYLRVCVKYMTLNIVFYSHYCAMFLLP